MIRLWVGIALLAVSWLPALGYYRLAEFSARWIDVTVWAVLVIAGASLMIGCMPRMPRRPAAWIAVLFLLPVILIWPWPYSPAAILLAAGLALAALPLPRNWPRRIGEAAVLAGVVLVVQALALYGYAALTARSHELPWPLTALVGLAARLLGQESGLCGNTLALFSMRQVHRLGATWELLLDPATLGFLAGGLTALLVGAVPVARTEGRKGRDLLKAAGVLLVATLAWLPVRAGVLIGLYMHRVLVTDYDELMNVMNQFWSLPLHLALVAGPTLLAWRFVGRGAAPASMFISPPVNHRGLNTVPAWRPVAAAALIGAAVAVFVVGAGWEPTGARKAGRVAVEEGHSKWEPTTRAMDTEWYGHDSGYNYACMYDYLTRFYEMSRLEKPVDDAVLKDLDVLVIKTPTLMYKDEEIQAIERWVKQGGGLVLIGEHTDVFHTGESASAITRRFGFEFRYDCLFGIDSFFEQRVEQPLLPHPVIQHMPPLDFAVSCSIDPGASPGRAVMRSLGLKNAMADYHASNFYPQAEDRPDMRYGAWVQLWATRSGQGRVVAFSDSTQFSNFSMFEPGKPELALGMIEWANYTDGVGNPRPWLWPAALALAAGGFLVGRRRPAAWAVLLAVGMLAHAGTAVAVRAYQRQALPMTKNVRPLTLVAVDRTLCDVVLPKGGFIGGREDGFGIFERWILRLGYFTERASGKDVARSKIVVVINPSRDVPREYVETLVEYVKGGGNLLVLDSQKNMKSTANSLLWPFAVSVNHGTNLAGPVAGPAGWSAIRADFACEVTGGKPWAQIQGKAVATTAKFGKGSVTVLGLSHRFCDVQMGVTGDIVPDATMRAVYEFEYKLFRALVEGQPLVAAPPAAPPPAAAPLAPPAPAPTTPPAAPPAAAP